MQAGKVFGAVAVEGDAHGDALLYLDKVARGIVDGKERESAARGTADALHATPIDDTGHGSTVSCASDPSWIWSSWLSL